MSQLERELIAYGAPIGYPDVDLWPRIESRLAGSASLWPRRLALIAIAALGSLLVALAVPPARSAVLRALGLDGVSIVRIDHLPPLTKPRPADLGRPAALDEAQAAVPFTLLLPKQRIPDAVYLGQDVPPAVTLVYGKRQAPQLLLSEFKPCCGQDAVFKEVPPGAHVERITIAGARGLWISGAHVIRRGGVPRLAGPTLLWQRSGVIFRLEADVARDQARRLAETLEPLS